MGIGKRIEANNDNVQSNSGVTGDYAHLPAVVLNGRHRVQLTAVESYTPQIIYKVAFCPRGNRPYIQITSIELPYIRLPYKRSLVYRSLSSILRQNVTSEAIRSVLWTRRSQKRHMDQMLTEVADLQSEVKILLASWHAAVVCRAIALLFMLWEAKWNFCRAT